MVLMHGVNGVEKCLVITIISMFKQRKLLCFALVARYCRSLVGNDYFWLARDVLVMGCTSISTIGGYFLGGYICRDGFFPTTLCF
jgi:hypothetical protein